MKEFNNTDEYEKELKILLTTISMLTSKAHVEGAITAPRQDAFPDLGCTIASALRQIADNYKHCIID
jgi:hypothetical protein